MSRQLLVIGTAVMTTLLALVALWQFRVVLIFVLLSLAIAATFRPISKSESRHDFKTRFLLVMQYVVTLVVIGLLIFIVGRFLINDFQQLAENLSEESAWNLPAWLEGSQVQQSIARWLPAPESLFVGITSQPVILVSTILGFTEGIGTFIGGFAIALILSVYWSINQDHFERLWLSLLPAEMRKRARYIWRTIERDLGAYIRSELAQSALAGILLGIGYWMLGSPYPTLLAVAGALAWLFPVIGGVLALILPLLLGLLDSPQLSLLSALYTIVIFIVLEAWVEPRLFRLKSNNQVLTFVILLILADAYGLLGIIAAPPLSVIVQNLWRFLVSDRLVTEPVVLVADLKERQARLQEAIQELEGEPPPLIANSMEKLASLLQRAEPLLPTEPPAEPHTRPRPYNLPS